MNSLTSWGQPPPTFAAYPAPAVYTGRRHPPKLYPHTAAWRFRTRIREVAQQRPNFAGHYVLATWGCGAECLSYVIVDVTSGHVYFNDVTVCCWGGLVPDSFQPIRFRLTSQLIIFQGLLGEEGSQGPHYYKFHKGRLIALS
ncbi:hypothetical protein [Hymenobacter sp. YC55]|uniref:hypothetical protein n=1 Tax=Hymenobacter sp. YC55 TaxID=3034019 RepID=UPI0023F768FB|nr:hypothetical protein [Hymenobacter sp. YC55]MDF7813830.1 hypothetical protein [Hymenobacter sp. YC55]